MVQAVPQSETTPFYPRSPYAAAKMYAYWITVNYQEAYDMFACNGILFNHESPLRAKLLLPAKVPGAEAKIALALQKCLYLGNLSVQRDWGHAKDYIEAMWLILQQEKPEDFVIATGITTTVRDFVRMSFAEFGIDVKFSGKDENEKGVIIGLNEELLNKYGLRSDKLFLDSAILHVDSKCFRPTDVDLLLGDPTKSKKKLGWEPKYDLAALVKDMMISDRHSMKKEGGFKTLDYFE